MKLSHTKWECKYHAVFIPKCRRKTLYVHLFLTGGAGHCRATGSGWQIVRPFQ